MLSIILQLVPAHATRCAAMIATGSDPWQAQEGGDQRFAVVSDSLRCLILSRSDQTAGGKSEEESTVERLRSLTTLVKCQMLTPCPSRSPAKLGRCVSRPSDVMII